MKITRKKKTGGSYSSSSMSDIVFMLLFFFMVTTTMRDEEILVKITLPTATETAKLERKDLTCYINVGPPIPALETQYGTDTRMQLNDSFRTINDIRDFVAAKREQLNESDRVLLTIAFKMDEQTRMGIVTDVKQELRRCQALKISYLAAPPKDKK
ncbi:MAG: biopolymer transporter ExbD [Prevotellaceae bacterium]|jgi:biopolymer transport protein ExbD|nr:biopolymer transporter ExbD [Prevotellaceae bacterium]